MAEIEREYEDLKSSFTKPILVQKFDCKQLNVVWIRFHSTPFIGESRRHNHDLLEDYLIF